VSSDRVFSPEAMEHVYGVADVTLYMLTEISVGFILFLEEGCHGSIDVVATRVYLHKLGQLLEDVQHSVHLLLEVPVPQDV